MTALATVAHSGSPFVLPPGRVAACDRPRPSNLGGAAAVLYLTAVLTVAALMYLGYAMIRPERF